MPPCSMSPIRDPSLCRTTGARDMQTGREASLGREGICKMAQLNASRGLGRAQTLALSDHDT